MKKKDQRRKTRLGLESQDDVGYLTGRRTPTEEEKQIKTPNPRRSTRATKQTRKTEEGGKDS
ncbi:MAG: hypothetical protein HYY30_03235 [Chloroflexi bacterium]|nr:hypothetical protein [Chloroflexota bacterium]